MDHARLPARLGLLCGTAALLVATAASCAHGQAFDARGLSLLGPAREVAIGKEAEPLFLAGYGGETPSPELSRYVSSLGLRVAARSSRPDLPWAFHVVDSEGVNAFALPGGKVFVTRGLLALLANEAQLAGVLAHEVAHVAADHVDQQLTREVAVQLSTADTGVISQQQDERWLAALGVSPSGAVYLLEFSRDQEVQADSLAVRTLVEIHESPLGQEQVVALLEELSSRDRPPPAWLATHPYPGIRRAAVASDIARHARREADALPLGAETFHAEVLGRLAALPPPRHHAVEPRESPPAQRAPEDDATRGERP